MADDQERDIANLHAISRRGQVAEDMILLMQQRGMSEQVIDEALFRFFTGTRMPSFGRKE